MRNIEFESGVIDALGGTCAVAEIFNISPASVSDWRKHGIPRYRKQTLAIMFPAKCPSEWRPNAPNKETRESDGPK